MPVSQVLCKWGEKLPALAVLNPELCEQFTNPFLLLLWPRKGSMGGRAKWVLYERQFSLPEGSGGTLSAMR